jgi:hypothetical protein
MSTLKPPSSSSDAEDLSLQLIDESKTYNPQTFSYFKDINIEKCGLNYHIVSVFGSQSTGKSTLLNALFGTRFDVMNEIQRRQTTKGIWMALAKPASPQLLKPSLAGDASISSASASTPNILVLDVEGTDGRERGEDQDFERKSALFALATSEVLIVNMWESQVGLYQGANMGLLKTVFEVNLALFQAASTKPNRSRILFVIRDHIGTTPLANLQATVVADLKRIWESLSKPPPAANTNLDDYFDLQFYALPHKILMPEQFLASTAQLSQYFTDTSSSSYVFKPEYHRGVPIDGWPIYSEKIWEQIEDNKDLDLPTQQILVARFRCEEIAAQAWVTFETGLAEAQKATNGGLGGPKVVEGFGHIIESIRSGTLDIFDSLASRYEKSVYISKRADLLNKVDTRLTNLYKAQLLALHKKAITIFNKAVLESTKEESKSTPFIDVVRKARSDALEFFVSSATEASVDPHIFVHTDELSNLEAELDDAETKAKRQEIKKISTKILKKIKSTLFNDLESYFQSPEEDTWDKILIFFNNTIQFAVSSATKLPTDKDGLVDSSQAPDFGVGASPEENEQSIFRIRSEAWIALDTRLKEIIKEDNILLRLRENFEDLFRYDDNGVPLVWKAGDDIETPYLKAREQALKILPIYSNAVTKSGQPIIPDVDLEKYYSENVEDSGDFVVENSTFSTRLSVNRQQEITKKFKKQADAAYVEAKRSTTQVFSRIPAWFYVILLVLGWNELMAVLRNPLLFLFVLLVGAGLYVAHTLNLWGPILSVTGAMAERTTEISKQKLREFLEVPGQQQMPAAGRRGGRPVAAQLVEEIELDDLEHKE